LVGWNLPYLFFCLDPMQRMCLPRNSGCPEIARPPSLGWEVLRGRPRLSGWILWIYPLSRGIRKGSKRLRPLGSRSGRIELVGWDPPRLFPTCLSRNAMPVPDPPHTLTGERAEASPTLHGRRIERLLKDVRAEVYLLQADRRTKGECPPARAGGRQGGGALSPVGFEGSTPVTGEKERKK